ncbi:MAG: phage protein Gp36 family protein [Waterburya sp.]
MLINGGQVLYSAVTIDSPNSFILQLTTTVNDDLYFSYSKPLSNAYPQLRNLDNLPLETQRRTKVLILSQMTGGEPIPDTASTAVNSFGTEPSVDDFILTYGEKEAIAVSNIGDCDEYSTVNQTRIYNAIQDALTWIDTMYSQAPNSRKALIQSTRRRSALIIARYYLDSCRRRENVTQDYERVIKEWDIDSSQLSIPSGGTLPIFSYTSSELDFCGCDEFKSIGLGRVL